jgi:hypothetical protein
MPFRMLSGTIIGGNQVSPPFELTDWAYATGHEGQFVSYTKANASESVTLEGSTDSVSWFPIQPTDATNLSGVFKIDIAIRFVRLSTTGASGKTYQAVI